MRISARAGGLCSHLDRHANIGFGRIGLGLAHLLSDVRLRGVPIILETPFHPSLDGRTELALVGLLARAPPDSEPALQLARRVLDAVRRRARVSALE